MYIAVHTRPTYVHVYKDLLDKSANIYAWNLYQNSSDLFSFCNWKYVIKSFLTFRYVYEIIRVDPKMYINSNFVNGLHIKILKNPLK